MVDPAKIFSDMVEISLKSKDNVEVPKHKEYLVEMTPIPKKENLKPS